VRIRILFFLLLLKVPKHENFDKFFSILFKFILKHLVGRFGDQRVFKKCFLLVVFIFKMLANAELALA